MLIDGFHNKGIICAYMKEGGEKRRGHIKPFLAGMASLAVLTSPLEANAQSRDELLRQEQQDQERAQAWTDYEAGRGADYEKMCQRVVDIVRAMFRAKEPIATEIMGKARVACPKPVLDAIEVFRQDQRRTGVLTPDLE